MEQLPEAPKKPNVFVTMRAAPGCSLRLAAARGRGGGGSLRTAEAFSGPGGPKP
jgi:hypothetical protein